MIFSGLQKLSLLDFPAHTACTVFTPGCNFRCPFCHNASVVLDEAEQIDESEVLALLDKRKGILDGVAVTGGEPLMHPELEAFLEKVKQKGFLVKLDTNGSYPERLAALVRAGLVDRVAMDIKNSREKYAVTSGAPALNINKIEQSVSFLLSGTVDYEFRTTVVKGLHTEDDFRAIGEWIRGAKEYFLQSFVNSGDILGSGCDAFPPEQMQAFADIVRPYVKAVALRGI